MASASELVYELRPAHDLRILKQIEYPGFPGKQYEVKRMLAALVHSPGSDAGSS